MIGYYINLFGKFLNIFNIIDERRWESNQYTVVTLRIYKTKILRKILCSWITSSIDLHRIKNLTIFRLSKWSTDRLTTSRSKCMSMKSDWDSRRKKRPWWVGSKMFWGRTLPEREPKFTIRRAGFQLRSKVMLKFNLGNLKKASLKLEQILTILPNLTWKSALWKESKF